MDILELLKSMKTGAQDTMRPVTDGLDSARGSMAQFFGDMKEIEGADGQTEMVMDRKAFSDRMNDFARASAAMSPQMTAPPSGAMRPQQAKSSPAPVMGAAPNPYAPANYGTMQYGQQMQSGIGKPPTMEQILMALQGRGL